jgi:hypothetical protein
MILHQPKARACLTSEEWQKFSETMAFLERLADAAAEIEQTDGRFTQHVRRARHELSSAINFIGGPPED